MANDSQANDTKRKLTREEAGARGGQATSRKHGPEFYAEIGRRGGQAVSRNRAHMSKIGQKGGAARGRRTQGR
jgi:uncharacterized protein